MKAVAARVQQLQHDAAAGRVHGLRNRTVLLRDPSGPGPLGAKAAGELTNTSVAPAVANAVAAAGARVMHMPLTAERVLDALDRS